MGLDGVRDNFVQKLDNTEWGISSNMRRLFDLIRKKDPQVIQVLVKQQLKPEFFAFRWLTLLLSQEFELPDVIAIWDVLFADQDLFNMLLHICCAMIL
jgi:TBC1 domain family member 13